MAEKERNIGKVKFGRGGAGPDLIEVTTWVEDDTMDPEASTSLHVRIKNLVGVPFGPFKLQPILTGLPTNTPAQCPTCNPTDGEIQKLDVGEEETVKFNLDNRGQPKSKYKIEMAFDGTFPPGIPGPYVVPPTLSQMDTP